MTGTEPPSGLSRRICNTGVRSRPWTGIIGRSGTCPGRSAARALASGALQTRDPGATGSGRLVRAPVVPESMSSVFRSWTKSGQTLISPTQTAVVKSFRCGGGGKFTCYQGRTLRQRSNCTRHPYNPVGAARNIGTMRDTYSRHLQLPQTRGNDALSFDIQVSRALVQDENSRILV